MLVNLSPLVGYRFTDKFTAGAGHSFIYTRINMNGQKIDDKVLGGRVFAQHMVFKNFAARGDTKYLNI